MEILWGSGALLTSLAFLAAALITALAVNFLFEHLFRWLTRRTKTKLDDRLIALLRRPVFWSLLFSGLYLALLPLNLSPSILTSSRRILVSLGLIIWGLVSVGLLRLFFEELSRRVEPGEKGILDDLLPFLDNLAKLAIAAIVLLTILSFWGIDITPALASAGVVGVAVAFAAKDTVANFFGGLSIFFDRPYKVGDYVIVKDEYRGEVIQIGIRSTKIRTRDNILLTVPNSVMVTSVVVNETGLESQLRIRIPLGIAYETDLEKVEKVLIEVLKSHPEILNNPAPRVRFRRFGDFALELEVLGVIGAPADRGRVTHELIKKITQRLRQEKIELPFPQQVIHLVRS